MVTLSLIAMSGLLLFLWWHKPLEPHGFVRIDIIRIPPPSTPDPPVGDVRAAVKMDFFREQSLGRRVKTIFKTETFFFDQDRRRPFFRALHSWLWSPLNLLEIMLNDYGALFLRLDKSIITEGSTEASTFYAPDTIDNLYGFFFTLENVLGSLFAATHISMLYNHFPTYLDMMVWRIASLVTVILPIVFIVGLIVMFAFYILSLLFTVRFGERMLHAMQMITTICVFLGFIGLLMARLALIVEAFVCMKSVGGTALQTVSWTNYIPHFA